MECLISASRLYIWSGVWSWAQLWLCDKHSRNVVFHSLYVISPYRDWVCWVIGCDFIMTFNMMIANYSPPGGPHSWSWFWPPHSSWSCPPWASLFSRTLLTRHMPSRVCMSCTMNPTMNSAALSNSITGIPKLTAGLLRDVFLWNCKITWEWDLSSTYSPEDLQLAKSVSAHASLGRTLVHVQSLGRRHSRLTLASMVAKEGEWIAPWINWAGIQKSLLKIT